MRFAVRLPPPPWIAAHRGALPLLENTIPSLLLAVEEGADLLEFDVQATADDVLVVFHDADLGRLGNRADLAVESSTADSLHAVELRDPLSAERRGRIPTLTALLSALPAGFPVNVELKLGRGAPRRLARLALAATEGRENLLFSSFDFELLRELRRLAPSARLAPLAGDWSPGLERLGEELGAWSLHVGAGGAELRPNGRAEASPGPVRDASAGRPLLVYTVNDAGLARELFARGAVGLFTDRPRSLREELGQPGGSGVLSSAYRG